MITSKHILEVFSKTLDVIGGSADVFVNPTSSDYAEIYKESKYHWIKFFADNKAKTVYVWNADKGIHREIAYKLNLVGRIKDDDILAGDAMLSGGKATMKDSDMLTGLLSGAKSRDPASGYALKNLLSINWSWVEPYISCKDWLSGFGGMAERSLK